MTDRQLAYREYLKSDHWASIRAKKKAKGVYKCATCGIRHGLDLHHLIYPRDLFETHLLDVCWLCRDCHTLFHAKFGLMLHKPAGRNRPWLRAETKRKLRSLGVAHVDSGKIGIHGVRQKKKKGQYLPPLPRKIAPSKVLVTPLNLLEKPVYVPPSTSFQFGCNAQDKQQ